MYSHKRRHANPSTNKVIETRITRRNAVIVHLSQYLKGNDRPDPPTVDGPVPENILAWAILGFPLKKSILLKASLNKKGWRLGGVDLVVDQIGYSIWPDS